MSSVYRFSLSKSISHIFKHGLSKKNSYFKDYRGEEQLKDKTSVGLGMSE